MTYAELYQRVARTAAALRAQVWASATGWPGSCPTCLKPLSPCWPPRASAPSGHPVRQTLALPAWSTALARSNRKCCFAPQPTATAAKITTAWKSCRHCRGSPIHRAHRGGTVHESGTGPVRRARTPSGLTTSADHSAKEISLNTCRSIIRCTSCFHPAPPGCQNALSTAPAEPCCST